MHTKCIEYCIACLCKSHLWDQFELRLLSKGTGSGARAEPRSRDQLRLSVASSNPPATPSPPCVSVYCVCLVGSHWVPNGRTLITIILPTHLGARTAIPPSYKILKYGIACGSTQICPLVRPCPHSAASHSPFLKGRD